MTNYVCISLLGVSIFILDFIKLFIKKPVRERIPDIGKSMTIGRRQVQEDQVGTMETKAGVLAVLSDGAGREYGGRIASRIAVDTCMDLFGDYNAFHNPQYFFRKSFHNANLEILKALGDENRGSASLGCVLLAAGYLYYAQVGNVKICVYREGNLIPISTGHTVAVLAEQKFHEGTISREDALALLENKRLYNYLGQDGFKDIELFDAPVKLKRGDIVVLMSDGIYDLLGVREIEAVLKSDLDCQQMAYDIIELVNRHPGEEKDNASIILLGMGKGADTYAKAKFGI
ncbi:PP2C family protein-serine/threonine phosphatase [Roseburia sp. 1XD42-69]|uniref:PP2C family protein-serine/threonine phosphatase n=1 Tax=Roseburia sp. 1XD42-69 TaxID=2320088 RepID=UPI000EA3C5E3|nr:protein phosphatase 2C domain-containing protein [Roseburia sp. 1XD42-69]RKJ65149.1 serine/threonine-protein phosphatase [Roseburia sp. 1XD42-69]